MAGVSEVWLAHAHEDETAEEAPLSSASHLKSAMAPAGHWHACLACSHWSWAVLSAEEACTLPAEGLGGMAGRGGLAGGGTPALEVRLAHAHDDDTADEAPPPLESHLKSRIEPGGHVQACLASSHGSCAREVRARAASKTNAARASRLPAAIFARLLGIRGF